MQAAEKIMSKASTSLSEYDAITETVQTYINGGKSGRGADMKPAFHPDATIFGVKPGVKVKPGVSLAILVLTGSLRSEMRIATIATLTPRSASENSYPRIAAPRR